MDSVIYDYAIVGAGLTGLYLGRELQNLNPQLKVLLYEKSKGCGGRMATRRIGDLKFDHGAQYIKETDVSGKLIEFWKKENVVQWFSSTTPPTYCGLNGMTQPAKKLAESLNISYNRKVLKLNTEGAVWELEDDQAVKLHAKEVVLTSPLPQSLEILQNSGLSYESRLSEVKYAKAIVLLLEAKEELPITNPYMENVSEEIFSICAQHSKGFSAKKTYTVVMSEAWSEKYFDRTEEELTQIGKNILRDRFPTSQFEDLQIKKWRYSHPQSTWSEPFYVAARGLYLAGDAFGGPSLNGALRSSIGIFEYFKTFAKT